MRTTDKNKITRIYSTLFMHIVYVVKMLDLLILASARNRFSCMLFLVVYFSVGLFIVTQHTIRVTLACTVKKCLGHMLS